MISNIVLAYMFMLFYQQNFLKLKYASLFYKTDFYDKYSLRLGDWYFVNLTVMLVSWLAFHTFKVSQRQQVEETVGSS